MSAHLTCPVTDFINEQMNGDGFFKPVRFSGFPELKEAFISGHTSATFILAPMAMALRGKRIAVPNRFTNQFMLIFKALRDRQMGLGDVTLVEMPPPDLRFEMTELIEREGGKRYLSGWIGSPPVDFWRRHFGARYEDWASAKRTHDPDGVLSSTLFAPLDAALYARKTWR